MDNQTTNDANDRKLNALTNEPVKAIFGGEEFLLRRPTIKDYKRLRAYFKERNIDIAAGKIPDEEAIDFGLFFISMLLISPQYTMEQLEDKILLADMQNLNTVMSELGFTQPQSRTLPQPEVTLTPPEEEKN